MNEIVDVILFGSAVRGKDNPRDIDVLIIFNKKEDTDISYELRKKMEKLGYNTEITNRTYKNLFDSSFLPRENILSEGYSVILNKSLSEGFGYKPFSLFTYSLKKLSKSKRIIFHYALKGRNKKSGILEKMRGIKLGSLGILIPIENTENFEKFMKYWNVQFRKFDILIPERVVEYREFEI